MTPSNCPTCGDSVTELQYVVSFIILDEGIRHKTHAEWLLGCGDVIHDELVDFHSQTGFGELIEKSTGKHLFGWQQPHPLV